MTTEETTIEECCKCLIEEDLLAKSPTMTISLVLSRPAPCCASVGCAGPSLWASARSLWGTARARRSVHLYACSRRAAGGSRNGASRGVGPRGDDAGDHFAMPLKLRLERKCAASAVGLEQGEKVHNSKPGTKTPRTGCFWVLRPTGCARLSALGDMSDRDCYRGSA